MVFRSGNLLFSPLIIGFQSLKISTDTEEESCLTVSSRLSITYEWRRCREREGRYVLSPYEVCPLAEDEVGRRDDVEAVGRSGHGGVEPSTEGLVDHLRRKVAEM